MKKTQIPGGVVISIQAVDMTLHEGHQQKIFRMLEKFKQFFPKITSADFFMQQSAKQATAPHAIKVRLGIPGPDVFASGSGRHWKALMGTVQKKIIQQLKKRKVELGDE
jgi:putative sigma-54 modulation protein